MAVVEEYVSRLVVALLLIAVFLTACTAGNVAPTTESASSTKSNDPFDTGIEGNLIRVGNASKDDGALLQGQVLFWGPGSDEPLETTTTGITMPGFPLAAAEVIDGVFAVELDPGWYRVRGTAIGVDGGEVCDEFWVEVKPHELTGVEFICR